MACSSQDDNLHVVGLLGHEAESLQLVCLNILHPADAVCCRLYRCPRSCTKVAAVSGVHNVSHNPCGVVSFPLLLAQTAEVD